MIVRILDLETADEDPETGAVCELAFLDYDTETYTVLGLFETLVNPEVPIPPNLSAIHHIVSEDVAAAPTLDVVLQQIGDTFGVPDVHCAHRAEFEQSWLIPVRARYDPKNIPWICTYKAAVTLRPEEVSHSNQSLRYSFRERGWDAPRMMPAHRALADCEVTLLHLKSFLRESNLEGLIDMSSKPLLLPKVKFGKHYGLKWSDMDTGFLDWVLKNDFDEDTLYTAQHWKTQRRVAPAQPFHEMRP